jgi:hypothetical protein
VENINSMNHKEFMKCVFKHGEFEQFCITPYASLENNRYAKFVLISDMITRPTHYTHKRKKLALILPRTNDTLTVLKDNIDLIISFIGVQATFIGVFDVHLKHKIYQIENIQGGELNGVRYNSMCDTSVCV